MKKVISIIFCIMLATCLLAGCGSEAKKAMDTAVTSANELLENGGKPFDPQTKKDLEKAVAESENAEDDAAYEEVTKNIETASAEYEKSVKQLKQVTNPKESFLIERAKAVDTITKVEAATEDTDSNKLMNKPGGYTSYVAMQSSMVGDSYYQEMGPVEAGCDGGAVIEAFPTVKDAKAREEYLATFDGSGMMAPGTHTVVGTLLIRTSNELTATQQKELEENIINALIELDE